MTQAPRLQGPLAEALKAQRDRCNALFAQARHAHARVDAAAFGDHLCERVAPIVNALAAVAPGSVAASVAALYDVSLEMHGADLLRRREIDLVWRDLLPQLPRALAQAPRRVVAAMSNASGQLAGHDPASVDRWLARMQNAARTDPPVDVLLACGQVAAWRCGLAHYREGALDAAASLSPELAALLLDLDESSAHARLRAARDDRWLDPAAPAQASPTLAITARAGGFRGFGGLFRRPPVVSASDDALFATDGTDTWQIAADVYGTTFHRVTPRAGANGNGPFRLDPDGTVRHGQEARAMPVLAGARSWAGTRDTLAVTFDTSHHLFLVAHTRG